MRINEQFARAFRQAGANPISPASTADSASDRAIPLARGRAVRETCGSRFRGIAGRYSLTLTLTRPCPHCTKAPCPAATACISRRSYSSAISYVPAATE